MKKHDFKEIAQKEHKLINEIIRESNLIDKQIIEINCENIKSFDVKLIGVDK